MGKLKTVVNCACESRQAKIFSTPVKPGWCLPPLSDYRLANRHWDRGYRGRRQNSWRCKEISVNRKQVTAPWVEGRSGRGKGGRKDVAELKEEKTEWRVKTESETKTRVVGGEWKQQFLCKTVVGVCLGQERLHAVGHNNTSEFPFVANKKVHQNKTLGLNQQICKSSKRKIYVIQANVIKK